MHKHTARSTTALTHVQEQPNVGSRNSLLQVCVRKHNQRRLTPKLQAHPLQVALSGHLHDLVSHRRAPSERNLVNIHVQRNRGSSSRTKSRHDVHNPLGKSNLLDQSADRQRGQRSLLTCLHHHSAPRSQSRTQLPRLHQKRKVPRDDLAYHSHRLVASVAHHLPVHRDVLPLQLVSPPSIVSVALDNQMQIDLSAVRTVLPRLPVVQ
mmetsp:Transcript_50731/g.115314  ORF Transcript_50731/g.115314 Transcript_50731/m.115314 type:complete len:208 (+) Transcript_50731:690-1313(+)